MFKIMKYILKNTLLKIRNIKTITSIRVDYYYPKSKNQSVYLTT